MITENNFLEELNKIYENLKDMLDFAPAEEDCSDEENEIFADMQNLIESIKCYKNTDKNIDKNKKLNYEEIKELNNKMQDIKNEYWKSIVVGFIENVMEVGDYDYNISENEIEKVANEILQNNVIWEVIDEHISQELWKYETNTFDENNLEINNMKIDIAELETLFNYVYGRTHTTFEYEEMTTKNKEDKLNDLKNFYKDIQNNVFNVNVFDTERKVIDYIFVEGNDEEQLVDNIEFLLKKINNNYVYDWKKSNNVLKINNKYFVIQW